MPLCTIFTRNGICWKMANKNTEESLVERLELGESLEKVVYDSLKAAASQAVEELIKHSVSEASTVIFSEIAGSLGGVGAKVLIRMLLRISDSVAGKLDTLCREPFETGIRVAQEALNLECKNENERRFREQQLMFALSQLERAWTLMEGKTKSHCRRLARLAQGICAAKIAGGANYALPRLLEWKASTLEEIEELRGKIRDLQEKRIPALQKEWETLGKKKLNIAHAAIKFGTPQQMQASFVLRKSASHDEKELSDAIELLANERSDLEGRLITLATGTLVIENVIRQSELT
jgi:hypothetical protein